MNPNSTFILPSKTDDADEEFVAKWLDKHGLKAVDKRHITLWLGGHDAEHLVHDLRDAHARTNNAALALVADAIAAQTKPPKPPEPGKYGAVIAGDGLEWFRYTTRERDGRDWCRPNALGGTEYARWDDIVVLRVTNEGVQP